MALFHLLLELKRPFQVAHVDHGWRPASSEGAACLARICRSHDIRFHLQRFSTDSSVSNLENRARRERLAFFHKLCEVFNFQGVMLAHQADDQAETVLKRVFEGASLPKLKGLEPKTTVEGVTLFRPLLQVSKKEITTYLMERGVNYFQDPTNSDPRFLRGRMREELLPLLSESFGKQVSTSLCRLGAAAAELGAFLDSLLEPYRQQVIRQNEEVVLNLIPQWPTTSFLWKAIIRDFFDKQRVALSSATLTTIIFHLQKKNKMKTLRVGKCQVVLDRGVIRLKPESNRLVKY